VTGLSDLSGELRATLTRVEEAQRAVIVMQDAAGQILSTLAQVSEDSRSEVMALALGSIGLAQIDLEKIGRQYALAAGALTQYLAEHGL
jgi:starvation-inducible outer membrane lipoprotein